MAERYHHTQTITPQLRDWGNFNSPAAHLSESEDSLIRGELDLTQLDLISLTSPSHFVERTSTHISTTPKRHIFSAMLHGESTWAPSTSASHQYSPLSLHPENIAYWTSEIPYSWNFHEPFTLLTFRIPFATLGIPAPSLRPLCGSTFSATSGLARHLVPFAQNILQDPALLTSHSGARVLSDLVSLFSTMLAGELSLLNTTDPSQPAFDRVTLFLADHLGDSLTLGEIAAANDMSPRYVQSLFQKRGTTLSDWIRCRRLELARQLLADPARASLGIGAIAHESGFSDHGHFARTFRAMYRETPTDWRMRNTHS